MRPAEVAGLYARYETEKRRRRLLDFDDLLGRASDSEIDHDAEFAAAQRWRFRHLFVDEFQDATPLQLRLLPRGSGERPDLSVVGDPAQAIYGFAGADAAPLAEFARHFPGGRRSRLRHNYRSHRGDRRRRRGRARPAAGPARDTPHAVRPADRPDGRAAVRRRPRRSRR